MTTSVLPRPEVSPARPWSFPKSTSFTLPNGLKVVVHDLPGKHLLAMRLVLDLPLGAEPIGFEGAALIALRSLEEGTERYDAQALAAARDRLGASYGVSCDTDAATVIMDVPSSRLAPAIELLAELVQRPTFPEAGVQRLVKERLDAIASELASADSRAGVELAKAYYVTGSRRAIPVGGTAVTVAAINRDVAAELFRARAVPATSTLVVAGDLSGVDLQDLVTGSFGEWQGSGVGGSAVQEDDVVAGPQLVIVDRPGSVQTALGLAVPAVARGDADKPALDIAAYALGGGMESRLMSVLREEKGYTYGIGARIMAERYDGRLIISGSVQTDVTGPAVEDLLTILRGLAADGVREEERAPAVEQLAGRAPLQYETAAAVAGTSASLLAAGLPADQVDRVRAALQATTVETVNAALQSRCPVEQLVLVAVGDASKIEAPLRGLGFDDVSVVPA